MKLHPAYVAGFLDGERCINIKGVLQSDGRRGRFFVLQVRLAQKNPEILYRFQKQYGGWMYQNKTTGVWSLQLESTRAKTLIEDALPYLVVKRDVALLAMQFLDIPRFKKDPKHRATLQAKISALNQG